MPTYTSTRLSDHVGMTKLNVSMKLIRIKRKTKTERRYTEKMGMLSTQVTYVKKRLLGVPVKTLHKYRQTYYGEMKECRHCELAH